MFRYAGEEGDDPPPPPPPLRDFALADFVAAPKPTSLSSLSPLTPLDSPIYNYIIVFLLSSIFLSSFRSLRKSWYNLSRRRAFFSFLVEGIVRIFGAGRAAWLALCQFARLRCICFIGIQLIQCIMKWQAEVPTAKSFTSGVQEAYRRLMLFLGLRSPMVQIERIFQAAGDESGAEEPTADALRAL